MINNWEEARIKAQELWRKREHLSAIKASLDLERKKNLKISLDSQKRLELSDYVREILERLQKREHERAVGAYEELLSAFLTDVLPGDREIVMDLHTDRNAPSLDIFIRKGENEPLEDAWLGTGGSVTNLLSTGLRLVALLRSGQRKFLVLDESDCWIKPDLIPRYANIVSQMSKELGVQILMISHHDESLFANHIPYRLKVSKTGKMITSDWSASSQIPIWSNENGIRSIILKNFQSHQHTCINLSPEVTLLQGDNDIGKSAVVNAIRAVFDGDSNDTMIKHHEASAQVSLDMGDSILSWQRFRKGKVKISYKLTDEFGKTIHESDTAKVPDWVKEIGIGKVEGLDIQIGQQQDPVFLLNQPGSQRAKALAIGQESGHVNNMMSIDKAQVQEARILFKNSEKTLEKLRRQSEVFVNFKETDYLSRINDNLLQEQKLIQLKKLLKKWSSLDRKQEILTQVENGKTIKIPESHSKLANNLLVKWRNFISLEKILSKIDFKSQIKIPELKSIRTKEIFKKWAINGRKTELLSRIDFKKLPSIPKPNKNHIKLLRNWEYFDRKQEILVQVENIKKLEKPKMHDETAVNILNNWHKCLVEEKNIDNETTKLAKEEQALSNEITTKFPYCPACHQKMGSIL